MNARGVKFAIAEGLPVGPICSPLSINALREDLQVSFKAVKRWLELFERFYAIYRLTPFGGPRIKAVKKEQKHYHYDWNLVKNEGARFENFVASHFIKWCNFYEDTQGRDLSLHFYRDLEQREVDFVVCEDRKPLLFLEAKLSDTTISPHLSYLARKFPKVPAFQVILKGDTHFENEDGIQLGTFAKIMSQTHTIIAKQDVNGS